MNASYNRLQCGQFSPWWNCTCSRSRLQTCSGGNVFSLLIMQWRQTIILPVLLFLPKPMYDLNSCCCQTVTIAAIFHVCCCKTSPEDILVTNLIETNVTVAVNPDISHTAVQTEVAFQKFWSVTDFQPHMKGDKCSNLITNSEVTAVHWQGKHFIIWINKTELTKVFK